MIGRYKIRNSSVINNPEIDISDDAEASITFVPHKPHADLHDFGFASHTRFYLRFAGFDFYRVVSNLGSNRSLETRREKKLSFKSHPRDADIVSSIMGAATDSH